jgi:hypothetical protein
MSAICTNAWLSRRAAAARAELSADHDFRLFKNDIPVSPTTLLVDFVEADFDTYSAKPLDAVVGAPQFVVDGRYRLPVGPFGYMPPNTVANTVYGWYIVNTAAGLLVWAQRWATPEQLVPLGKGLRLTVFLDNVSGAIL